LRLRFRGNDAPQLYAAAGSNPTRLSGSLQLSTQGLTPASLRAFVAFVKRMAKAKKWAIERLPRLELATSAVAGTSAMKHDALRPLLARAEPPTVPTGMTATHLLRTLKQWMSRTALGTRAAC